MTTLAAQPWLTAPETVAVLDALEAAGGSGCVRFVGGSVRNALMGQPVDDIDLATTLPPDAVVAALKAAGIKVVPTGLAHGTVTAVSERRPHEITTLRRDVSTDGRNATVAFTDDWAEDAARRDFRLNALYADRHGTVFDPTGHGVADAAEGRIVFVGDPETRIAEDYLRILRFFRFFAWYGRGDPDPAGLAACDAMAPGLTRLSAERVSKELLKLLAASDPRRAVAAMIEADVLSHILPEAHPPRPFEAIVPRSTDPVLRLAALLPADADAVTAASARLRLPNAVRDRLVAALRSAFGSDIADHAARAIVYREGRQAFHDRLALAEAASGTDRRDLHRLADTWTVPRMPVGGRDLARLGLTPGPDTGRVLKAFEDDWVAADFPIDGHDERLAALTATAPNAQPSRTA